MALSLEGARLGVTTACSASVSCLSSQSENTEAARSAADRREMKVARVRIALMSDIVGGVAQG